MALQNLRSSTPSKRPDASSMSDGQIALNTAAASAGLFFKDSNGDLVKTGPVHIGTTAPNSTPATGGSTGNSKGEAWLDTSNGNYVLKIYDGTSWQSVEIAPGSARQLLQTNAAGTDVEFTSNVDVPGTLDVTGATTLDSTASVAGLLSANGKISFAEGNAAAPGIYPGSDTDTGISSPSLNELSFSTAGTSRLHIASDGKVGVGTAPSGNLDVMSTSGRFLVRTDQSNLCLDSVNTANSAFSDLRIRGENILFQSGGTEHARITNSGKIGVGTSSPAVQFDIVGDANDSILPNNGIFKFRTGGGNGLYMGTRSSSPYQSYIQSGFQNNNNNNNPYPLLLNPEGGNVGIGTSNPSQKLEISGNTSIIGGGYLLMQNTNSVQWGTSDSAYILGQEGGSGYLKLGAGGDRVTILNNGNVGIGTTSPGHKLDVYGGTLGTTASNAVGLARFFGATGTNTDQLKFEHKRTSNGTDWTTAAHKIFRKVDATDKNYIQFGLDTLEFGYGNSEAMRLDSSGRLGIGATDPGNFGKLFVKGGQAGTANSSAAFMTPSSAQGERADLALYSTFQNTGDNGARRSADIVSGFSGGAWGNEYLAFHVGNNGAGNDGRALTSEKLRIKGNGQVLVGTSTTLDTNYGTTGGNLQVVNAALPVIVADYNNHQYGPRLDFVKSRAGTTNGKTIVVDGDQLGNIIWGGADGSNIIPAATISCNVDTVPGTNDMPGRLTFLTTQDGSSTPTERMRIASNGYIYIHTTSVFPGVGNSNTGAMFERAGDGTSLFISRGGNTPLYINRNSGGGILSFRRGGTEQGQVVMNDASVSYNTTSDYRLKENVVVLDNAIDRVKQLLPKRFNFINYPDETLDGFLAHEAQAVVPECVTGTKDEVDDDGNPVYQGIDQAKLVPLLSAALQEAIAKIETLEQRLNDAGL